MATWCWRSEAATTSTWNSGAPSVPARPFSRSINVPSRWKGRAIDARLRPPTDRPADPEVRRGVAPRGTGSGRRFDPRRPRGHAPAEPLFTCLRAVLPGWLVEEDPAPDLDSAGRGGSGARLRYRHRTG